MEIFDMVQGSLPFFLGALPMGKCQTLMSFDFSILLYIPTKWSHIGNMKSIADYEKKEVEEILELHSLLTKENSQSQ